MYILKEVRRHDRRNSPGSHHLYVIAMKAISPHQYNHSGGSHIVPVHSNSKLPPKTPFFTSSHLTTHTSPLLILRPPPPPPSSSSSSPSPLLPHLSLQHLT